MIPGLNTDIEHEGRTYHVQTEDSGPTHPAIVTFLFQNGAILATRKTDYADLLKAEHLPARLKEMINDQHKKMIQDLKSGRVGGKSPPSSPPPPREVPAGSSAMSEGFSEKSSPSPMGWKKSLDDMILDYLASREEPRKP